MALYQCLFFIKFIKHQQILEDGISKKHAADLSIAVSDIVTSVIIGSSFDIENNESIPDTTVTIGKLLFTFFLCLRLP